MLQGRGRSARTSLCPLRTLADGYKVLALQGQRMTAWQGLYAAPAVRRARSI